MEVGSRKGEELWEGGELSFGWRKCEGEKEIRLRERGAEDK